MGWARSNPRRQAARPHPIAGGGGLLVSALGAILGLVLAGLSGCSSLRKGDGPPRGQVDFDSIPDAMPRVEPKSPYGNPPSYEVFGQRYYPLETSRGYLARGTASWYGTQFHGKRASIGEPYDMYAMTAAHKTLPLPSYVRVTNLENGRSIVVRVNDRGPFVEDRLIDLSYVAAGKLRVLGPGTAPVEVRALSPGEPEPPTAVLQLAEAAPAVVPHPLRATEVVRASPRTAEIESAPPPTPRHPPVRAVQEELAPEAAPKTPHLYVQAGAFGQRENAERLRAQLSGALPHQVRIRPNEGASPTLYRVQVGPLTDRQLAESVSQRLAGLGVDHPRVILE